MHDNSTVEVFPVAVFVRQAVKLFFTDPGFDNKIGWFQAESHRRIITPATQPICHPVFVVEVTRSRFLFVAVMACCCATTAQGHPIPFSYLDLRLAPGGLDGTLTVHVIDLAHDLNLETPGLLLSQSFVESNRAGIMALVQSRLVLTADGETLQLEPGKIEALPERQSVGLQMSSRWSRLPGVLGVRCGLFPYDPQHQTFLNIYEGDRLAHQEIFDKDRQVFEYFTGSHQGTRAVVKKFVPAGVHHI